jgi:methylase of polypeptide subunit release factors
MISHSIHQGVKILIETADKVYKPGLLTETICNKMVVKNGDVAVDVGCGTGYIGITAALLGAEKVIAIDPCQEALECTLRNAALNNVKNLCVRQGLELEPVKEKTVDLIITLPPQMPFLNDFNPERYGGIDGTDVIIKIIREAGAVLKKETGRFYLVHSALANPEKVREVLNVNGFSWQIVDTVEKELIAKDINSLTEGLFDYIMGLYDKGLIELVEKNGRYFYPVWFYLIKRSK